MENAEGRTEVPEIANEAEVQDKRQDLFPGHGRAAASANRQINLHAKRTKVWFDPIDGAFDAQVSGRLDPTTGKRYALRICPAGSPGLPYEAPAGNALGLLKYSTWNTYGYSPSGGSYHAMGFKDLTSIGKNVGTDWHTVRLVFRGDQIEVSFDGEFMFGVQDREDDPLPLLSGGVSIETYNLVEAGFGPCFNMYVDSIFVAQ